MAILKFNMSWAAEGAENFKEAYDLCTEAVKVMSGID